MAVALLPQPAGADHVFGRDVSAACPANQVALSAFRDVSPTSPAELAVSCLSAYGITTGVTPTRYDPAGTVSRAQMAVFLYRLGSSAGVPWRTGTAGFRDLGGLSAEARAAVDALAGAGVAQGRSPSVFDPAGQVTRGAMASFLVRLADAAGAGGFSTRGDAFDDDETSVHRVNIDRLAGSLVTNGRGSHRSFDPFSPTTREQMASFLARTLSALVVSGRTPGRFDGSLQTASLTLGSGGGQVEPGTTLTGQVGGHRVASASIASACTGAGELQDRDAAQPGVQFAVRVQDQAPAGRCVLDVRATYENGRTQPTNSDFLLLPGLTARPELVDAQLSGYPTSAGFETTEIRFVFDEPVTLAPDGGTRFLLDRYVGGDSSTRARKDGDRAVIATFGRTEQPVGPADVSEVSYASLVGDAVLDEQGQGPPVGTRAVLHPGSSSATALAGPTWQPDLLSVTDRRPDPRTRPASSSTGASTAGCARTPTRTASSSTSSWPTGPAGAAGPRRAWRSVV